MHKTDNYKLFFGIDFLRFILSCIILIAHFPHFSAKFIPLLSLNRYQLPLYDELNLLYDYGGFAVQIFWMISGIVFYNFYDKSISSKKICLKRFIFLRLTKLYPIHIITLFLVTILQYNYFSQTGKFLVYQNFDIIHFFLNLFMVSYWNAKYGLSFNGPFWSVSVELFVYIVFYYFSFSRFLGSPKVVERLILIFFIFYVIAVASPFHECLLFFFIGVYIVKQNLLGNRNIIVASFFMLIFSTLLLKFYDSVISLNNLDRIVEVIFKLSLSNFCILFFSYFFSKIGLFAQKSFRFLSNITYSIYMFHFSVQLFLVLIFQNQSFQFFNSISFLILYFIISICIGVLSFYFIEAPFQNYLRNRLKILS